MNDPERFTGVIIRHARLLAGSGLREFAEAARVSPSRLSQIQQGEKATTIELALIADQLQKLFNDRCKSN